jgi:hypothetical protein
MIDELASTLSLARAMRMSLGARLMCEVQTAQLRLILDTFIDFGTPREAKALGAAAEKAVEDHIGKVELEQRFAAEDAERAKV